MNWKDNFIIYHLKRQIFASLSRDFENLTRNMKNTIKYQFFELVKDRYFESKPEFVQNMYRWTIDQLIKIIPNSDWKNKKLDKIVSDYQNIIYEIIEALDIIEENTKEKSEIKKFSNIEELKFEADRIKLKKMKTSKPQTEVEELNKIPEIVFEYDLNNNHYDVYLPKTISQLSYIGRGTKWCFGEDWIEEKGDSAAKHYYDEIKDGYPLYVIVKNKMAYISIHENSNQWLNKKDLRLTPKQYEEIIPVVEKFHITSILFDLYKLNLINKEYIDKYIPLIVNDPIQSYKYAYHILKQNRWPQDTVAGRKAEMSIAQNGEYACYYAINCIKTRWPQDRNGKIAEYNIAKHAEAAHNYAVYLEFKWNETTPLGQKAITSIAKDAFCACDYAIKFNFEWDENTDWGKTALENIVKNEYWETYWYHFGGKTVKYELEN